MAIRARIPLQGAGNAVGGKESRCARAQSADQLGLSARKWQACVRTGHHERCFGEAHASAKSCVSAAQREYGDHEQI
eukprot:IDg15180t1